MTEKKQGSNKVILIVESCSISFAYLCNMFRIMSVFCSNFFFDSVMPVGISCVLIL